MSNSVEWLERNFKEALELPSEAVSLLLMLYSAAQTFDDYADGDPVSREELDALIWNTLVAIPENQFYRMYSHKLTPVIATTILKWQGSDRAEREGQIDAKTFGWRAGYFDIVLLVFNLVHGVGNAIMNAQHVMNLYGEVYEDYLKEFDHA